MRKRVERWIVLVTVLAGAACRGGASTVPTSPAAAVATPAATPVPVSISYSLTGPAVARQVSPTLWDYVVGDDVTYVPNLAGKRFTLSKIQLDGSAISGSEFANFDIEVHLNGKAIAMRSGTLVNSTVHPETGFAKPAVSQLRFSVLRDGLYDPTRSANLNLGLYATFTAPSTLTSVPSPYSRKSTSPVLSFDLTDGLHAQLCIWSGSEYNYVVFRNLRLSVEGSAQ